MFGQNKILGIDNVGNLGVVNIFNTIQGEGPHAGMPAIFIRLGGCNLACKFCDTEFDQFESFSNEEILIIALYLRKNRNNNIAFIDNNGEKSSDNNISNEKSSNNSGEDKNSSNNINKDNENSSNTEDSMDIQKNLKNILNITKNNSINNINLSNKLNNQINDYLIVITGGEPMRYNIAPLINLLIENNFMVQIETNGTIYRELPPRAQIVYSPKCTSKLIHQRGYSEPNLRLLDRAIAIKILISNNIEYYNDIPWWLQIDKTSQNNIENNFISKDNLLQYLNKVILQPIDEYDKELNRKNLNLAIALSFKHNVKLSLQLHKIINVE